MKKSLKSIFVTGAGGFVGQRLILQAAAGRYRKVYCLCRKASPSLAALAARHPHIEIVRADLFDPGGYRDALADADIAVHLAAVTGKAAPETYTRVNVEGTAIFIEQCRQAGVGAFLHFSTIAVNFQDVSGYPYARSKQEAEKIVENGGLRYAIVRPTIIFGDRSPIWNNFLKMACAPVPFVFGNGRTRIQPIHVDDLSQAVLAIIDQDRFDNAAWSLGGRQVVTIEDLVRQIRRDISGRPVNRLLRIPLTPLSAVLRALEPFALGLLPFTAGQLTSFSSHGVTGRNDLMDAIQPCLRPLGEMIGGLVRHHDLESEEHFLHAEARQLARRITGHALEQTVLEKYVEAHRKGVIQPGRDQAVFEQFTVKTARFGPVFYLAEAFSSVFHRNGLLRKKMILLSALLECMPATESAFEAAGTGSRLGFVLGLAARSLLFGLALLASVPVFLPLRMLLNVSAAKQVKATWKN